MEKQFVLDTEDERIINELDNLCGVMQNKEVLRNMIYFSKLKNSGEINFGNYNIVLRNDSSYNLTNDFLKICGKLFLKHNIISNDKICYLDRAYNTRKNSIFNEITDIDADIIVINDRKLRLEYLDEIENLEKLIKKYPNKILVFEDKNFMEGEADAELGDIASWRMKIDKISQEDKTMYCEKMFNNNMLKFKKQDLKEFTDQPFWVLKRDVMSLIIECKSNNIDVIDKKMIESKCKKDKSNVKRNNKDKIEDKTTSKNEIDKLVGLDEIKEQINKILNYIKINKERGKMPTLHMCFNGNPGTGKTSVARVIGKIFEEEKILSGSGEFVEIHGRDLVAKYVGWTAQKVHDTVEKAIGGVLFIDEAYSLVSDRKGGFEDEAIATLIKEMEDHRDEICIIFAGYTEEMNEFIKTNPGFESRIQFYIDFPDYNEEELLEIFEGLCKEEKYRLTTNCREILLDNFRLIKRQKDFGNGRYVRNLFEKIKFEQATRVVNNNENKDSVKACDIVAALENVKGKAVHKKRIGFAI